VKKNHDLSVRRQCELLHITRSTLYYEPKQPDEAAVLLKEEIMARIDFWHTQFPCMGTRKLAVKLRQEGYHVGRKLVRSLMREMGIHTVYPKANLSKRNFRESVVPYLLRNKVVYLPNQVWSIDITYIKMHRGHMYLTAIIDWYSRKIVGWNLSDTLDTQSVIEAVRDAVETHGTPAILNSDQGCQFTSEAYKKLLKDFHIRQSMDGKSHWADNIMIERWFRSLKTELIYINEFSTPKSLRIAIRQYIHDYNTLRPHEALDYATPEEVYRGSFGAANAAGPDSAALAC
jgi:putative transposase